MVFAASYSKRIRRTRRRTQAWRPPPLTIGQILKWADDFQRRTGKWPNVNSGPVRKVDDLTWKRIDSALRQGCRGLSVRSTLGRVLYENRGVGRLRDRAALSVEKVLAWADAHRLRHHVWPTAVNGIVDDSPGNTWCGINSALIHGLRGLPPGRSLAELLAEERGFRNIRRLPNLSVRRILRWADGYQAAHKRWPEPTSGKIPESGGETWRTVADALMEGKRGLKKTTLPSLLAKHRGRRNHMDLSTFDVNTVLRWADQYFARHQRWPTVKSGAIPGARGETWAKVSTALACGLRGLRGGSSLAKLLLDRRGVRYDAHRPPLHRTTIRRWAARFKKKHGKFPSRYSGPIPESDGDSWSNVELALYKGHRGLPGGMSLATLLKKPSRLKPR
jgi:hypothetical protein